MALHRLAAKGLIWRIGGEPCVWWRLPVILACLVVLGITTLVLADL